MKAQWHWFLTSLNLRGSIFSVVLPRAIVFGILAIAAVLLYGWQSQFPWEFFQYLINNVALNLILGLLLVFRTNTSYERFWEGCKAWGGIITAIRTLLREFEDLDSPQSEQQQAYKQARLWLVALAIATQAHLRGNWEWEKFQDYLTEVEFQQLQAVHQPPMLILRWLSTFVHQYLALDDRLTTQIKLDALTENITSCERILKTPTPFAYTTFLRQFILLYCFFFPFGLVESLTWGTVPITILVALVLFGVEAIAEELEDPFGEDANDLPLAEICQMLAREATDFDHKPESKKVNIKLQTE